MTLTVLLLSLAAVARVTRFLTSDVLFEPARLWVEDRAGVDSRRAYLLTCPWCASIWVSAAVIAVAAVCGDSPWFQWPAAALGSSYVYGLAATRLDPDDS